MTEQRECPMGPSAHTQAAGLADRALLALTSDVTLADTTYQGSSEVRRILAFRVCYARNGQTWDRALHRIVDVLDGLYTQHTTQQIGQNS